MRQREKKVRKLVAAAVAGATIAAIPASAGGAPVKEDFLTIGGPNHLAPTQNLRVPIRCSVECDTTVFTTLRVPGPNVGPSKTTGHLQPGKPRDLRVKLNNSAAQTILEDSEISRLRVVVRAENVASDETVRLVKIFRFSGPT